MGWVKKIQKWVQVYTTLSDFPQQTYKDTNSQVQGCPPKKELPSLCIPVASFFS